MALIDDMFALASAAEKEGKNKLIHQPPSVRTELLLLSSLAPLICTNVSTTPARRKSTYWSKCLCSKFLK